MHECDVSTRAIACRPVWTRSVLARKFAVGLLAAGVCVVAASCSTKKLPTVCEKIDNLSQAVGALRNGIDELSGQYAGELDTDISESLVLLDSLSVEAPAGVVDNVTLMRAGLAEVQSALDNVGWDIEAAKGDTPAIQAVDKLRGDDMVTAVTMITNYVNGICATTGTVDPSADGIGTLPAQTIPTPPVTDPPMGTVDNGTDARAIGYEIATTFGITATDEQLECLGTQLQDVVDKSDETSTNGAYNRQFQAAFDECGIDFTVPAS